MWHTIRREQIPARAQLEQISLIIGIINGILGLLFNLLDLVLFLIEDIFPVFGIPWPPQG